MVSLDIEVKKLAESVGWKGEVRYSPGVYPDQYILEVKGLTDWYQMLVFKVKGISIDILHWNGFVQFTSGKLEWHPFNF